ncbi:hypothetical protein V1264_013274 [Littorina saxatilis]|uniref:Uncharacterized protein n=1 Tax=Littorina saxatilis TaxID=31220 RepID=A0AAN9GHL0_9CAEN
MARGKRKSYGCCFTKKENTTTERQQSFNNQEEDRMLTYSMKLLCGPTDMTFYVTSSISQIFLPWKQIWLAVEGRQFGSEMDVSACHSPRCH